MSLMTRLLRPGRAVVVPVMTLPGEARPVLATADEERVYTAPQWRLVWWKFRKHKVALVAGWLVVFSYFIAAFAEPIAPYAQDASRAQYTYAPPTKLHFVD